jgi:hypothetical protein|tara:strand:- start:171 stop:338 length:168 start_codon:yes stop_codon:yes gene_type:complete
MKNLIMILLLLGSYPVYSDNKTITLDVDGKKVITITVAEDEPVTETETEEEPDCE